MNPCPPSSVCHRPRAASSPALSRRVGSAANLHCSASERTVQSVARVQPATARPVPPEKTLTASAQQRQPGVTAPAWAPYRRALPQRSLKKKLAGSQGRHSACKKLRGGLWGVLPEDAQVPASRERSLHNSLHRWPLQCTRGGDPTHTGSPPIFKTRRRAGWLRQTHARGASRQTYVSAATPLTPPARRPTQERRSCPTAQTLRTPDGVRPPPGRRQ